MKRFSKFASLLLSVAILLSMAILPQSVTADETTDAAYRQSLIDAGFPESYADGLTALHNAHPTWSFTPYQTGLTWAETLTEDAEMYPSRNLVSSSSISSWFSNNEAYYNAATNTYTTYDSGKWCQVSLELLEHFMDPRNFFDERYIFQFEQLSYNSSIQNESGVSAIIKNSFMKDGTVFDSDGNTYTYTEAIMDAAVASSASPYYIASKMLNEQGIAGTSALIAGGEEAGKKIWAAYQNDLASGLISAIDGASETYFIEKYRDLYNYFNIGASGTGYFRIYTNGLEEARAEGWTTPYAAIIGGAKKAAEAYINKGQDTLYLQKFNVTDNGRRYWGQYMQSIHGSYSLASTNYNAYVSMGAVDNAFTFSIPVFLNMPEEACPKPTGTNIANTLLRNLSVTNTSAVNFKQYTTTYDLIANASSSSVTISAAAVYSSAEIKVNGTTIGTGSIDIQVPIESNTLNSVTIEVISPDGATTYTLNINSNTYCVEGYAVNGTLHFGDPSAAAEYNYVNNVEYGRDCGITFIPAFGYVVKTITRSDNVAVEYTKGYAAEFTLSFTMPANDLTFNIEYEPMFPETSQFSVSMTNGTAYISGFDSNETVASQIEKLRTDSALASSTIIKVYNSDGSAAADTDTFVDRMKISIEGTDYYTSARGDVDADGTITIADAAAVYNSLLGRTELTEVQKNNADLDDNGIINILDVMNIINNIIG